jgi:hypothetical protein
MLNGVQRESGEGNWIEKDKLKNLSTRQPVSSRVTNL